LQLCGRAHYRATRKYLESRTQLKEPVECASGGDPLLIYKILHLLFFPLVRILCALRLESRKNDQYVLDAGPLEFQFLRLGRFLTNPFSTLSLFSGHRQNTRSHLPQFVKKNFVCIGHQDNVFARCDSIFPLLRCQAVWNKTCTQLSLFQIIFRIRRTAVLGMFIDSAIILDAIRRSFLTKSATAAMFTSVRVDSGRPPLSSSLPAAFRLEIENTTYKCLIGSEPHSHKPFAPILVFLWQIDRL
jgi:hypothetical protein